ncbi:chloramphenicol phosphotransferase CPT family protein [Tessaracoccus rhinocerotis]
MTQVIVLNGGSSSGNSGIVRCLQHVLPRPWISMAIDDLINQLPSSMLGSGGGIAFGEQGEAATRR